jgi:hypothetical protein
MNDPHLMTDTAQRSLVRFSSRFSLKSVMLFLVALCVIGNAIFTYLPAIRCWRWGA